MVFFGENFWSEILATISPLSLPTTFHHRRDPQFSANNSEFGIEEEYSLAIYYCNSSDMAYFTPKVQEKYWSSISLLDSSISDFTSSSANLYSLFL